MARATYVYYSGRNTTTLGYLEPWGSYSFKYLTYTSKDIGSHLGRYTKLPQPYLRFLIQKPDTYPSCGSLFWPCSRAAQTACSCNLLRNFCFSCNITPNGRPLPQPYVRFLIQKPDTYPSCGGLFWPCSRAAQTACSCHLLRNFCSSCNITRSNYILTIIGLAEVLGDYT